MSKGKANPQNIEKLKVHGVDIDRGTVSIRLWED